MSNRKKCKCGAEFVQYTTLQNMCIQCAIKKGKKVIKSEQKHKEKEFRAETRKRKAAIKPKSRWLKETQALCNKFIRLRDRGKPCFTCGKLDNGEHQRHASHYRAQGNCSPLRFHHMNIHASCSVCNNHLSGNLVEYNKAIVSLYGQNIADWLDSVNYSYRWEIEEIKEIKEYFKEKIKEIENG